MKKRFRLKHALVLGKRNLIKLTRTPEQLIDVTLQPVIFLTLFLRVRRRDRPRLAPSLP